jgi:hypothetical protein
LPLPMPPVSPIIVISGTAKVYFLAPSTSSSILDSDTCFQL